MGGTPEATPDDHVLTMIRTAVQRDRRIGAPPMPADEVAAKTYGHFKTAEAKPRVDRGAQAYINHGRWVVDCPNPGCAGAELVHPDDSRLFCASCYNDYVGGAFVKVKMPPAAKKKRIEAVLGKRPAAANRNWFPKETVADLERENREHEIE